MDFTSMNNDELSKALTEKRDAATALFALTEPTIEQVNEAETLVASIKDIEAEQSARAEAVKDAADRFAAAKTAFASDDMEDDSGSEDAPKDDEEEKFSTEDESDEGEADEDDDSEDADEAEAEAETGEAVVVNARTNHTTSQKVPVKTQSTAKRVAKRTKRPEVKAQAPVTITAAQDIPEFSTGQSLDGMDQVTKALMNRVKGFAPFNAQAAKAANTQSGGREVLTKVGVASFGVDVPEAMTASQGNDYSAVRNAVKAHQDDALTAGGWCAPSTPVYSYIADYVIDGLVTVPEVSAPRGGLLMTTGPAREHDVDQFGFVQTEAQAIARTVKTCETIVCPDFVDHRLDAFGYCYKIPILTQKAYPEIVTDALRYAGVLYAHKMNKRVISDMVALSTPANAAPYGASFTDTLEALSIIAVKKRHWWAIGENAVMEVKLPQIAKEVFRADMSRRNAVSIDAVTDQQIDAHFAARRLSVEYVADWQDQHGPDAIFPATFDALIYPSGTFVKAVEDVINLSAVYDAASLSINEYTGVFFEQGIFVAKAGYDSSVVTIPVCTAGATGAAVFSCDGSF